MGRNELVEAGAQAICAQYVPVAEPEDRLREDVGVVIDAVEPLIRADERSRFLDSLHTQQELVDDDQRWAVLRAKMASLNAPGVQTGPYAAGYDYAIADVLALIDNSDAS